MGFVRRTIDDLFSNPFEGFRVPRYQRYYVWGRREWNYLWDDIARAAWPQSEDTAKGSGHFMGVLLTRRNNATSEDYEIIDGQQRLATFQIVLCCIRDLWTLDNNNFPQSNLLIFGEHRKLALQSTDDEIFQAIVSPAPEPHLSNPLWEDSPLWQARSYFRSVIRGSLLQDRRIDTEKLQKLLTSVTTNFVFGHLDADQDQQPERLFESINGRGRHLDQWDLLRNNLYLRAGEQKTGEDLFKNYWEPVFDRLESQRNRVWESESFFKIFLRVKLGRRYHNVESQDLYTVYQDNLLRKGQEGVESELKMLAIHGRAYSLLQQEPFLEHIQVMEELDSNFSTSQVMAFAVFVYVDTASRIGEFGAKSLLLATLEVLRAYARSQIQPTDGSGNQESHPLSKKNSQLSNIIDVKGEFVLRDLINWLSHDWRIFRHEAEPGTMQEAFQRAGIDSPTSRDVFNAKEARGKYIERENAEFFDYVSLNGRGEKAYHSNCRVVDGAIRDKAGSVVQGHENFVIATTEQELLENPVTCAEGADGPLLSMLEELDDDRRFVFSEPCGEDIDANLAWENNQEIELNRNIDLLKVQFQDPALIYLVSRFGHRILGRMGSYDGHVFYIRCEGKDIIVPKHSVRSFTPIYEGLIRVGRTDEEGRRDMVIVRIGQKNGLRFRAGDKAIDEVLNDLGTLGEPGYDERVWFWLLPSVGKHQIVDGAVRVERDCLSIKTEYQGTLKYWGSTTYGWIDVHELGEVFVHKSAFRDVEPNCDFGALIGEELHCNVVETYGKPSVGRRLQARNVKLSSAV